MKTMHSNEHIENCYIFFRVPFALEWKREIESFLLVVPIELDRDSMHESSRHQHQNALHTLLNDFFQRNPLPIILYCYYFDKIYCCCCYHDVGFVIIVISQKVMKSWLWHLKTKRSLWVFHKSFVISSQSAYYNVIIIIKIITICCFTHNSEAIGLWIYRK